MNCNKFVTSELRNLSFKYQLIIKIQLTVFTEYHTPTNTLIVYNIFV